MYLSPNILQGRQSMLALFKISSSLFHPCFVSTKLEQDENICSAGAHLENEAIEYLRLMSPVSCKQIASKFSQGFNELLDVLFMGTEELAQFSYNYHGSTSILFFSE